MFSQKLFTPYAHNTEAEAEAFITEKLRNRVTKRLVKRAHLLHERGTLHVPAPYNVEEATVHYFYGALQAFDRRAFLVELDEARARRNASGGGKESRVIKPADENDTMSVVAMFAKVDTSGDGGVTREELVKNCHLLNLSVEEAHRLFDKLDVNGDGEVSAEEFAKAVVEIENNAVANVVYALCAGDVSRLEDGLHRHTRQGSFVDAKRLNVCCRVNPRNGEGTFGTMPLLAFPNQNGDLGRRLGGDVDRRIPRCSHVATDELEIAALGMGGHGISGGLFLIDGDTLLHAVMRNAHLPHRCEMAEVLLKCGIDPNTVSSDGKKAYELDLEGRRHVWRRDVTEHKARRAGLEHKMGLFASVSVSDEGEGIGSF